MYKIELVPEPATITEIIDESHDVKSFVLERVSGKIMDSLPGQFVEISLQGYGEATFAISRLSEDRKRFTVSVKRIGHLTRMLHRSVPGETVGLRGPYGQPFPVDSWQGKHIVVIGGGIGLAPLRPVIDHILSHRKAFGRLDIVFGARSPEDMLFKKDLTRWQDDGTISLFTTIDIPHEGWEGKVGFVPDLVKEMKMKPGDSVGIICGPPIMIKLTLDVLRKLGWKDQDMFTTLEMKMQCGIGQCGRCNIGEKFICKDGPVFSVADIPAYALV